jgi:chorismate mutase
VTGPAEPARAGADDPNPVLDLVDAAAQRLQTADPVAAYKWVSRSAIDDPPRVEQVLATVTADANARHLDAGYVTRIFDDQIDATDGIEYTRFAQWKFDPGNAPTAAPGLSASRSAIDSLNHRMVDQIAAGWETLHSPTCGAAVADATAAVTNSRQLDPLYRQALSFATRSYCG